MGNHMMKYLTCGLAALFVLFSLSADAQFFPGNAPANTVYGNNTGTAGLGSFFGPIPLAIGGTNAATAAAARAAAGLNVEAFTGRGDAIYTILPTDKVVGTNAAFSASHAWTLPAASAVNPGQPLVIADFFGTVTVTNTIVITRAGSDTINGGTTVTINSANGAYILWSDGISKWTAQAIGGSAISGVSSFIGRTGAVSALASDYTALDGLAPAHNCTITASVAGNNLTIAMKDNTGADPSATSPCVVTFPSSTLATGSTVTRTVTAATSLVLNAGSTLGTTSAIPFRIWVTFFDTGSTAVLGASVQTVANTQYPLDETGIVSSTACNACATATSAGVFYTTAAQTSKSYRIAGFLDWGSGLATAGSYASGPTKIRNFGPGVRKPGESVQKAQASTTVQTSNSTTTFADTACTATLTPTSAANPVVVTFNTDIFVSAAAEIGLVAVRRNSSTVIGQIYGTFGATGSIVGNSGQVWLDTPSTASAVSYTVAVKENTAGSGATVPLFGCVITLQEIMG
jgi:hypothetical protein